MSPALIQRVTVAFQADQRQQTSAVERFSLYPPPKPCLYLMIVEYIVISLSLKRGKIPPV